MRRGKKNKIAISLSAVFLFLLGLLLIQRQMGVASDTGNLVLIVVEEQALEDYGDYIDRYMVDIRMPILEYYGEGTVDMLEVKRSRYDLDGKNPLRLTPTEEQKMVYDISRSLKEKYRNDGLIGVVLIGRVPIPQVDNNDNQFPSFYPYIDFDEPGFAWSRDVSRFVPTDNIRPTADIWVGYIDDVHEESVFSPDVTMADYFDANHAYYSGEWEVDKRILYNDFIREYDILNGMFPDGIGLPAPTNEEEREEQFNALEQALMPLYEQVSDYVRWTGRYAPYINKTFREFDELYDTVNGKVDTSEEVIRYLDEWSKDNDPVIDRSGSMIHQLVNGLFGLDSSSFGGTPGLGDISGGDADAETAHRINDYLQQLLRDLGFSNWEFDYLIEQPDGTFLRRNILNPDEFSVCFNNASEYDTDIWNSVHSSEGLFDLTSWLYTRPVDTVIVYALNGPGTVKKNGSNQNKWFFEARSGDTLQPSVEPIYYYYVDEPCGTADYFDRPQENPASVDEYYRDDNRNRQLDSGEQMNPGYCSIYENDPVAASAAGYEPGYSLTNGDSYPSSHRVLASSGNSADIKIFYVVNGRIIEHTLTWSEDGYQIPELQPWEITQAEPFVESPGSYEEMQTLVTWLYYLNEGGKRAYIFKEGIPPVGKYASLNGTYEIIFNAAYGANNQLIFKAPGEGQNAELVGACLQDRVWKEKTIYSVILGGAAGYVPNSGPIGTMALWEMAKGQTLGVTAQMSNQVTMELHDGERTLGVSTHSVFSQDGSDGGSGGGGGGGSGGGSGGGDGGGDEGEGEVDPRDPFGHSEDANKKIAIPGLTDDLVQTLEDAGETQNPMILNKIISGLSGSGGFGYMGTDDALYVGGIGFEYSPFILGFTSGMPIGEALKPYFDATEIYFGDPLIMLQPLEQ